jgi:hypothetical protein
MTQDPVDVLLPVDRARKGNPSLVANAMLPHQVPLPNPDGEIGQMPQER